MVKKFKLNGKQTTNTLSVEIGSKVYSVPLAKSIKLKELRSMKDEESIYEFFSKYIDSEVLEDLTANEYSQIVDAWVEANKEAEGISLGE
jgi:hypothetical protein